jgi:DnaK suppressor protein
MNNLSEIDVSAVRARLEALREQLHRVEVDTEQATEPVEADQGRIGRLSRAAAMESQAISLELKQRRTVERHRIAAALQRIEDGEYGFCVNCGHEIAMGRLTLDPATPVCIDCARRAELAH